jgi:hypothetical protein
MVFKSFLTIGEGVVILKKAFAPECPKMNPGCTGFADE